MPPIKLSDAEIAERLTALPHWRHEAGAIRRTYRTFGWKSTLMLVTTIGHLAEAAWHHPELHVTYTGVEVALNTHDADGITALDFALAKKMEEVICWQPNKEDGILPGTPQTPEYVYIRYDT